MTKTNLPYVPNKNVKNKSEKVLSATQKLISTFQMLCLQIYFDQQTQCWQVSRFLKIQAEQRLKMVQSYKNVKVKKIQ